MCNECKTLDYSKGLLAAEAHATVNNRPLVANPASSSVSHTFISPPSSDRAPDLGFEVVDHSAPCFSVRRLVHGFVSLRGS